MNYETWRATFQSSEQAARAAYAELQAARTQIGEKPDIGDFARLYRFNDLGQVLVMLDLNPDDEDREAEIRFHFDPGVDALGVCSAAMCFEGTHADDKAKRAFARLTADDIKLFAGETVQKTRSIFSDFQAEDDD